MATVHRIVAVLVSEELIPYDPISGYDRQGFVGHLISHRAHSLRPIGTRAYAPAGVRREKTKNFVISEGSARGGVNVIN